MTLPSSNQCRTLCLPSSPSLTSVNLSGHLIVHMNTTHAFMRCSLCAYITWSSELFYQHLNRNHPRLAKRLPLQKKQYITELGELSKHTFDEFVNECQHWLEPRSPVPGLVEPTSGYRCCFEGCRYVCGTRESICSHMRKVHAQYIPTTGQMDERLAKRQRLQYLGLKRPLYFPVSSGQAPLPPLPNDGTTLTLELLKEESNESTPLRANIDIPLFEKLAMLLSTLPKDQEAKGFQLIHENKIVSGRLQRFVKQAVRDWVFGTDSAANKVTIFVKQHLVVEAKQSYFIPVESHKAKENQSTTGTRLACFFFRVCRLKDTDTEKIVLPDDDWEIVAGANTASYSEIHDAARTLLTEIENRMPAVPTLTTPNPPDAFTANQLEELRPFLTKFFYHSLCRMMPDGVVELADPLMRFFACLSLKHDTGVRKVKETLTSEVSQILGIARSSCCHAVAYHREEYFGEGLSEKELSTHLKALFCDGEFNTLQQLRKVREYLGVHMFPNTEKNFIWMDDAHTLLQVSPGVEVSLDDVRTAVPYLLHALEEKLNELLPEAFQEDPQFCKCFDIANIHDDVNATDENYSFLVDEQNSDIFPDLEQLHHLYRLHRSNILDFDHLACTEWLTLCNEVLELLFPLIHICCGGPPRSPSWTSVRLRNSLHNGAACQRHVSIMMKQLCFTVTYDKAQGLRSTKYMDYKLLPLPDQLAQMFLRYLVYVRPVESTLCGIMYNKKTTSFMRDFLFASRGTFLTSEQLASSFSVGFCEATGIPLSFNEWRHAFQGWSRFHLATAPCSSSKPSPFETAVNIQMGHSNATGRDIYCQTLDKNRHQSLDNLRYQFSISREWQHLIGALPQADVPQGQPVHIEERPTDSIHRYHITTTKRLVMVTKKRSGDLPGNIAFKRPKDVASLLLKLNGIIKTTLDRQRLFKTEGTEKAFVTMMSDSDDLIYIATTGSGKSCLFQYPPYIEEKLTVVVFLAKSVLYGHAQLHVNDNSCAVYSSSLEDHILSNILHLRLLFVQVEHSLEALDFLKEVKQRGQLARIVVDEVHLAISHHTFRPVMDSLVNLRSLNVQMVYLSATVPPTRMEELRRVIGAPLAREIRDGRMPLNHRYSKYVFSTYNAFLNQLDDTIERGKNESSVLIVFVMTVEEVETLMERYKDHNPVGYHARVIPLRQQEMVERLSNKQCNLVFATTALAQGVDFPGIAEILIVGSHDLMDIAQMAGRGGRREGETCFISICMHPDHPFPDESVLHFMRSKQCIRSYLDGYLYGFPTVCLANEIAKNCSYCCSIIESTSNSAGQMAGAGAEPGLEAVADSADESLDAYGGFPDELLPHDATFYGQPDIEYYKANRHEIQELCPLCLCLQSRTAFECRSTNTEDINFCARACGCCFICFASDHYTTVCPFKATLNRIRQNKICSVCLCPERGHKGDFGANRCEVRKGFTWGFPLACYRHQPHLFQFIFNRINEDESLYPQSIEEVVERLEHLA